MQSVRNAASQASNLVARTIGGSAFLSSCHHHTRPTVVAAFAILGGDQVTGLTPTQYASWLPKDSFSTTFPASDAALVANATHIVTIGGANAAGAVVPPSAFKLCACPARVGLAAGSRLVRDAPPHERCRFALT